MPMSSSGRRCASLLALLVLAAGLVLAGAAAASASGAPHEMACCPADAADERGCAWLGAGDCCPERPVGRAPTTPNAAPPVSAAAHAMAAPAFVAAPAPAPPRTGASPHLSRSAVLRL